jgi:hypothetical protein
VEEPLQRRADHQDASGCVPQASIDEGFPGVVEFKDESAETVGVAARPHDRAEAYEEDERIDHPSYGEGLVVKAGKNLTVRFWDKERTLQHGRK